VKVSADGGETWVDRGTAGGDEPQVISAADDGTLYVGFIDGTVEASDDEGKTWRGIVRGG
jgi:hypothetical protein